MPEGLRLPHKQNPNNMSKDKDPKASSQTSVPSTEVDKPLPQGKLPKDLQKLVDDEDSLLDQIYDGK